jgi:hypothetical protein
MTLKTIMDKEVILNDLIGKNLEYKMLKTPERPAYPKGDEVQYSDDFISKLNEVYPLTDILGKDIKQILEGWNITRYIMSSPLNSTEGEDIMGYIITRSVQAEKWQPFIIDVPKLTDTSIKTAKEYLNEVAKLNIQSRHGIEGGLLFGLAVAKNGGFAHPFDYNDKLIIMPTQSLIEYFARR